jgi:hypothetical protein
MAQNAEGALGAMGNFAAYGGPINRRMAYGGRLNYAHGGPHDPPKKVNTSRLKDPGPIVEEFQPDYRDFLFNTESRDPIETKTYKDRKTQLADIGRKSKGCLAGALNCNIDILAPKLGATPTREIMKKGDRSLPNYRIPSRPKNSRSDYVPNTSIDAWEIHDYLRGEGLGSDFFTADENTEWSGQLPKGMDYSTIPVGAILGQGNSSGEYTDPSYGDKNRHALTVVGYSESDGMPLVYDSGKLLRLDKVKNSGTLKTGAFKFTNITVPNEYKDYTYKNFKSLKDVDAKKLALDNTEPFTYNSDKPHIQSIEKGVNRIKDHVARDLKVPTDVIEQFAKYLPGIGMQETKLGSNEGFSKYSIADNVIGNKIGKKAIKWSKSLLSDVTDFFKEGEQVPIYKLQIEAAKKYPHAIDKQMEYYQALVEENSKKAENKSPNYKSSVGAFAIKDIPEYSKNTLGYNTRDLYGLNVSNEEELERGAEVALTHLATSFKELKKEYKNSLTDEELIDLSIVKYNNIGKTKDPDYIEHFIKNKKFTDNYLESVKGYNVEEEYSEPVRQNARPFSPMAKMAYGGEVPNAGKGMPLKTHSAGTPFAYQPPKANGYVLPDPNRPELLNTGATEYKMGFGIDGEETQVPSVVQGNIVNPLDRYKVTGNRFKPTADPGAYSKFYDQTQALGLMQSKAYGGEIDPPKKLKPRYKANWPDGEVRVTASKDDIKYPYYNQLTPEQQKHIYTPGAIGNAVRGQARRWEEFLWAPPLL